MKQQTKLRLNLEPAVCEWCPENTPATARAELIQGYAIYANLCTKHAGEAASDFTKVNLYTLDPEPSSAYEALEAIPSEMKDYTVAQLEAGERYGVPYPVCGDLTARKRGAMNRQWSRVAALVAGKISWTGHDPDGTQY